MHAADQRCAVYYCIRLLCFFSNLPLSLGRFLLHPTRDAHYLTLTIRFIPG